MDVYLDTAAVIYMVENVAPWEASVRSFLARENARPRVSMLTRLECRVLPMRDANTALLAEYDEFFNALGELIPLEVRVIDKATELRAKHKFRTPDALHRAAAIVGECQIFLTNDGQLSRCKEIRVERLP
jgi:predicted nucleic acid-binding protein